MLIFIGYIVIISIAKLIMQSSLNDNKKNAIIAGSFLFIICALRTDDFGSDSITYTEKYLNLSYLSLSELWLDFITYTGKDPFFYLFAKVISLLGGSCQVWFAIIAGIYCFSATKLIYKYSTDAYISFIALLALGYLYFSLTGLRQALALSMIMLSYTYLRERKFLPFVAMVLLGALFHSSALVFLIAYPCANMKIGKAHFIGISAALVFAYIFSSLTKETVTIISSWTDSLAAYSDREVVLSISGFLIQGCILLFCLFNKKNVLELDSKNLSLYNLLFLGLFFQSFVVVIAEAFRVSMYFSIFSVILMPNVIDAEQNRNKRMITYAAVFIALLAYFIWNINFYLGFKFYWE